MFCRSSLIIVCMLTLSSGTVPLPGYGADDSKTTNAVDNAANVEQPRDAAAPQIIIQSGYLGKWFTEDDDETRLLILRVSVTNQHARPITVARSAWLLTANGQDIPAIPMPPELSEVTISIDGKSLSMDSVKTHTLRIDAGKEAATWLVFKNIPDGGPLPDLTLTCNLPEVARVKLDVDQIFAERLGLRIDRTGPADAIALLTINGSLDTVNVGVLAQKIDLISSTQICRIIVHFAENSTAPDRNVAGWLRQVALQSGRNPVINDNFPTMPTSIIDFHIVNFQDPSPTTDLARRTDGGVRWPTPETGAWSPSTRNVHQRLASAVDSAVAPLCDILSREKLLQAVRRGDSLTRAAVMRHGSERLIDGNLPLILSLIMDADPDVANAAIFALRSSSNPVAIKSLVEIATSENDTAATTTNDASPALHARRTVAVQSLAASKYAAAHSEIIRLFSSDDSFLRTATAAAVTENPRPVWSEPLVALFQNSGEARQVELLPALAAVGHPRLLTVLEQCLTSKSEQLSSVALNLLIAYEKPEAEQLASDWMLRHLETSFPSPQVLAFLRRTRDHRAVPQLLRHLNEKSVDREDLLMTVLSIGDNRVAEQVAASFTSYSVSEQFLILKALSEVRSEVFWKLVSAIVSRPGDPDERSLGQVVGLLQAEGSDRAVALLIKVLSTAVAAANAANVKDYASLRTLSTVCSALASVGTAEARDALREAVRNSRSRGGAPHESLSQLYQRSPAMRFVSQGMSVLRVRDQVALAMLFLDAAVKTDPELPVARLGRGNAALHIDRPSAGELETARDDFARYVELEPEESEGHTGLALVLVRQGKIDAGIAAGEAVREQASGDSVYYYNMACVYGRAIEQLEAHLTPEQPEQKSQIEDFRTRGVVLLQESIDNGLDDSNLSWMQEDPDLKTIRQSLAFAELLKKHLGNNDAESPEKAEPNEIAPPKEKMELPRIPTELQPR